MARSTHTPRSDATSSPLSQPRPLSSLNQALEEIPALRPKHQDRPPEESPVKKSFPPDSPSKPSTPSAAMPARTPTLSWQQRPDGLRGPRARPATFLEPRESVRAAFDVPKASSTDDEPLRTDIAKSLSSKDPSWFRQTADRGVGSAALRRNDSGSADSTPSEKRQLHGLSSAQQTPDREGGFARSSVTPTSESISYPNSNQSKPTTNETDSSIMSDSIHDTIEDTSEISRASKGHQRSESESTVGRREPLERTGSPTKGMGGFVQSAMLRRSESINKRWNVNTSTGLSRQGSTAGYMDRPSSRDRWNNPLTMPASDISTLKRPTSRGALSRPGSAHSSAAQTPKNDDDSFAKPPIPLDRDRSKTLSSRPDDNSRSKTSDQGLQSSPSKRWSPTKSSWLESALSKPDTVRAKPPPPSQPSWLSDLQKNRQQRQSKDIDKDLGRSAPLWSAKAKHEPPPERPAEQPQISEPDTTGIAVTPKSKPKPARLSDGPRVEKNADYDDAHQPQAKRQDANDDAEAKDVSPSDDQPLKPAQHSQSAPSSHPSPPPAVPEPTDAEALPTPAITTKSRDEPTNALRTTKPLPDRPNKPSANKPSTDNLEFLSAANKLRRAETQKYVAPDTLGDNIRRGKAGLAITGGPKPNQRRDEFKESLLEQKQRMKEKGGERPKVPEKRTPSIPEALRKRQALGKGEATGNVGRGGAQPNEEKNQEVKDLRGESARSASPAKDAPDRGLSPPTVSAKLAGRFNPAIANVLTRGPPSPERSSAAQSPSPNLRARSPPPVEARDSKPLEHKTKGRARGPKRRLPKAQDSAAPASSSPPDAEGDRNVKANEREGNTPTVATKSAAVVSPRSPQASPKPAMGAKPVVRSSSRTVSVEVGGVGAAGGGEGGGVTRTGEWRSVV